MFRFLTIALLAGAAIPTVAMAQDDYRPRNERGAVRADRGQPNAGPRPDRAPRAEQPQRNFTAAPVAQPVQAQPTAAQSDRGGWRGNRGGGDGQRGGWNGNRGGDGQRGNWNGNRGDGGWRGGAPATPPAVAAQPQPVQQDRGRGQRDWNRGNDGRDWNRNDGQRNWNGNDGRRDWNRDNGQRNWNGNDGRRDWNRNDGRRDWNDRRYDNDRRWSGDRGYNGSWNRGWRSDRRYNWQGYRASNRYAYRWPTYYAPRGWGYGYRRFDIGATLFAGLFAQNYWIGNPYDYRLPPVDWPLQWVRYYDDALLVDTETGQVVDVIPGIFW